jgi:hypothetical protein
VRENDWQWGLTVQQELLSRLSLEVGYARRWFQGVTVTDNQNRTPDQYTSYTVTAPSDPRLPGGGGYPITIYQASDAALGLPAANYITFQTDFGPEETNYWHGIDITLNARTRWGLTFSGGSSTGRSVQDVPRSRLLHDPVDRRAGQRHSALATRGRPDRHLEPPELVDVTRVRGQSRPVRDGAEPAWPRAERYECRWDHKHRADR